MKERRSAREGILGREGTYQNVVKGRGVEEGPERALYQKGLAVIVTNRIERSRNPIHPYRLEKCKSKYSKNNRDVNKFWRWVSTRNIL